MPALLDQLAFNATAAAVLAPLAFATRWLGRPTLTHAAWMIVMLRLVMPPIWSVGLPADSLVGRVSNPSGIDDDVSGRVGNPSYELTANPIEFIESTIADVAEPPREFTAEPTMGQIPPTLTLPHEGGGNMSWMATAASQLPAIWAAGSIAWFAILIVRVVRFHLLICRATQATPATVRLVARLSRYLKLQQPPLVKVVNQRLSPCVTTHWGRTMLVLPAGWLDGLDRLQQAAVLVHELAHLRRRDHLVRWLEAIVMGIYWWHPAAWVARRELREAEELCCDGWVVATLPAARRAYAVALVDTVDFLSPIRPALPPLASGFGQVRELRRRLHMILRACPAHRPGKVGAAFALGFGLLLLPLGLVRTTAQDGPQRKEGPPAERKEERRKDNPFGRGDAPRAKSEDRARSDMDQIRDELRQAMRAVAEANRAVEMIAKRLEEMQGGDRRPDNQPRPGSDRRPGGPGQNNQNAMADLERAMKTLKMEEQELLEKFGSDHPSVKAVRDRMERVHRAAEEHRRSGDPIGRNERTPEPGVRGGDRPPLPRSEAPTPPAAPRAPDAPRPAEAPRAPSLGGGGGRGGPGGPGGPNPAGNQRIAELEKELAELRKELAEIRKERQRKPEANNVRP